MEELVMADITARVSDIAVQGRRQRKKPQKKHRTRWIWRRCHLFDTVKDDDVSRMS
ncbi:MAG: hypothetical protein ACLU7M_01265 [Mediterraneibacter gnavus]